MTPFVGQFGGGCTSSPSFASTAVLASKPRSLAMAPREVSSNVQPVINEETMELNATDNVKILFALPYL